VDEELGVVPSGLQAFEILFATEAISGIGPRGYLLDGAF